MHPVSNPHSLPIIDSSEDWIPEDDWHLEILGLRLHPVERLLGPLRCRLVIELVLGLEPFLPVTHRGVVLDVHPDALRGIRRRWVHRGHGPGVDHLVAVSQRDLPGPIGREMLERPLQAERVVHLQVLALAVLRILLCILNFGFVPLKEVVLPEQTVFVGEVPREGVQVPRHLFPARRRPGFRDDFPEDLLHCGFVIQPPRVILHHVDDELLHQGHEGLGPQRGDAQGQIPHHGGKDHVDGSDLGHHQDPCSDFWISGRGDFRMRVIAGFSSPPYGDFSRSDSICDFSACATVVA